MTLVVNIQVIGHFRAAKVVAIVSIYDLCWVLKPEMLHAE